MVSFVSEFSVLMRLPLLALCCCILSFSLMAQDSLVYMQYNLTNYGNNITGCTSTNNGVANKDAQLNIIIPFVRPDILCVNEMSSNDVVANRILNNVLVPSLGNQYRRETIKANSFQDIANCIYYNSDKVRVKSHISVNSIVRVIDVVRMYHNSSSLATGDTTFFNVIICHLKAGNTNADSTQRRQMIGTLNSYLNQPSVIKREAFLMSGDFNVYTSAEPAFQHLIRAGAPVRFYDPINTLGAWGNNNNFRAVHTQSSVTTSNGCFSAGGLDDRFDFILINDFVKNDSAGFKYVPGTYRAIGQDGNRFNSSVSAGNNRSVPANVAAALEAMSDHLPVVAKFFFSGQPNGTKKNLSADWLLKADLSANNEWLVQTTGKYPVKNCSLYTPEGRLIQILQNPGSEFALPAAGLATGLYLMRLEAQNGAVLTQKLIRP